MSAITIRENQALARASRRPRMEKKIEDIRIHVDESLKFALMELAAADDRALGDYCRRVLAQHVALAEAGVVVSMSPQRSGEDGSVEGTKRDD